MNMKQIILLLVIGIFSFVIAFGGTWWIKRSMAKVPDPTETQNPENQNGMTTAGAGPESRLLRSSTATGMDRIRGMGEKELAGLIDDIRDKMKEYEIREKDLALEEQRIQMARGVLQEELDRLTKLNEHMTLTLEDLTRQDEQLQKTRIQINSIEKANIQRLATTYDKMDPVNSSKIMVSMMKNQQMDDAIKIVYYMSDRTAAELLGQIATTQPDLAGVMSLELKKIKEESD
ncbi:MAG: hypothetical protein JXA82_11545 [Sedimentisphaerales bacterium]|nr:hypothetical protein [Sedimentisphaerales bacterium]